MATLINGDGNPAVYAAQDADMLSGAFTNDKTVILDVGEKFRADVLSSSVIEIHDGVILTKEGRRIQLDQNAVDLFEIPAGEQGETSYYWIGYKLEIDEDSHQICNTFVQKMDNAADTIPEGSFREGDTEVYISLYHVVQDSLGVLTPTIGIDDVMTMIDLLDYVGSKSSLPDQSKSITQNIGQLNSDLSDLAFSAFANCGINYYLSQLKYRTNKYFSEIRFNLTGPDIEISAYSMSTYIGWIPDDGKPSETKQIPIVARRDNGEDLALELVVESNNNIRIYNPRSDNIIVNGIDVNILFAK